MHMLYLIDSGLAASRPGNCTSSLTIYGLIAIQLKQRGGTLRFVQVVGKLPVETGVVDPAEKGSPVRPIIFLEDSPSERRGQVGIFGEPRAHGRTRAGRYRPGDRTAT